MIDTYKLPQVFTKVNVFLLNLLAHLSGSSFTVVQTTMFYKRSNMGHVPARRYCDTLNIMIL